MTRTLAVLIAVVVLSTLLWGCATTPCPRDNCWGRGAIYSTPNPAGACWDLCRIPCPPDGGTP